VPVSQRRDQREHGVVVAEEVVRARGTHAELGIGGAGERAIARRRRSAVVLGMDAVATARRISAGAA
jgi:hypothetical protein